MHSRGVHDHDAGSTPQALAERRRLLDEGESRLRAGDADGARQAFEQAALQAHEAHIELGILRAQMQAGDYRHALAFAAHTAGVHLDEVQGRVFYAWLLKLGGQEAIAAQTLAQAEATAPVHPMVRAARRHFQSGECLADGVLLATPARLAPFATGAAVARGARVVASAILLADGRHALAPQAAVPASGAIWLRNGLGQTVAAVPAQQGAQTTGDQQGDQQGAESGLGLVLLKLAAPLPLPGAMAVPPRDAFPGSPAYAIDYAPDMAGEAAWPLMRLGFLGAPTMAGSASPAGRHRLGVALPGASPRGGPVYDQGGRLVGLALRGIDQVDRLVPVAALRGRFGERFGSESTMPRPVPMATDELYERAMKASLQVLVGEPMAHAATKAP